MSEDPMRLMVSMYVTFMTLSLPKHGFPLLTAETADFSAIGNLLRSDQIHDQDMIKT